MYTGNISRISDFHSVLAKYRIMDACLLLLDVPNQSALHYAIVGM